MNSVFDEAKLGSITLRNRIIRSATHEGLADQDGKPTEALVRKYAALAKGEVGAIITGYAGVAQNGKSPLVGMLMIDNDNQVEAYRQLTDEVHRYNTPIIMQIAHCGRQTYSRVTGCPTVAPSSIRDGLYDEDVPVEMSEGQIKETIEQFVLAVQRAQKAGFDGVQLHLAHGYLLSSFLSPHMNKRKDAYGGSTENRFRIVREIIRLSRERVGNYPIWAKMNSFEKSKDGIKTDEAIKIACLLEEAGCDAVEISCGIGEEGFVSSRGSFPYDMVFKYNHKMKKVPSFLHPLLKPFVGRTMGSPAPLSLYDLPAAQEIKKHVKIPVIVVGGVRKIDEIRDIIENEKCDFVSMSRPFIIEADIVKKFKEGKQCESKCINCNYCMIGIEVRPLKCYYGRI